MGSLSTSSAISNNATLVFNRSDTITQGTDFASVISGTGAVINNGNGTLVLNGANTFTGALSIQTGTLSVAAMNNATTTGALGNSSTAVTLGSSGNIGTLLYTGATASSNKTLTLATSGTGAINISDPSATLTLGGIISGSGAITKNGSGTLTLSGVNTFTGGLTIKSGTLVASTSNSALGGATGAGAVTLGDTSGSANATLVISNFDYLNPIMVAAGSSGARTISATGTNPTLGGGITLNNTLILSANSTTTLGIGSNSVVSGLGALVVNSASTGIVSLGAANTFSGGFTLNSGVVKMSSNNVLGTSTVTLNGGVLASNNGNSRSVSNNLTVGGNFSLGQSSGGTGAVTLSGTVDLGAATRTITVDNTTDTISGVISNGGLTKAGSGTLILSGNNTYSGATNVSAGTLVIASNLALQNSALDTSGAGSVTLAASITTPTIGGLSGSNNLSSFITGNYSTITALTLNPSSGVSNTYSGVISNGVAGTTLTKNGIGTQILSGANTYTGATTINAGTLQAAATGAIANTSQVVLNNGGSFLVTAANAVNDSAAINLNGGKFAVSGAFDETVGALTLSANSTIDLAGFAGTLRFGGVGSWASGTNLAIWNWNGINEYGTSVGDGLNNRHVVFTNNAGLGSYLDRISFYSDNGTSFAGNAFELGFSGGGTEIIAVPEPESYATACILLLAIGVVRSIRLRAKQKSLELYPLT
jgi:autotransporter-associated beta strand protein